MSVPPPDNPNPGPPPAPFCPRCGAPNEAGLTQCPHCGQSLLAAWPPPPNAGYPAYTPPPSGGAFGGLIPDKNPSALTAYYLGIFSIIPCLGLPMGIAAVVLGFRGLDLVKERPEVRGRTHALVGLIVGGLFGLINLICLLIVVAGIANPHPH
ncbi:MAG: hypothetical protein M3Y13_13080 [Armatimonadota bacterium]|nr:hypothetical protein [Armatimonadota bacterium]